MKEQLPYTTPDEREQLTKDNFQFEINLMLKMHSLPKSEGRVSLNTFRAGSAETKLHTNRKIEISNNYRFWIMEAQRKGTYYDILLSKNNNRYGHKYKSYGTRIRDLVCLNIDKINDYSMLIPLDIHEFEINKKNAIRFLDYVPYSKEKRTIEDLKRFYPSGYIKNQTPCRDPDVDNLSYYLLKIKNEKLRNPFRVYKDKEKPDLKNNGWIYEKKVGTDNSKQLFIHIHSKKKLTWNPLKDNIEQNNIQLNIGWNVFKVIPDLNKEPMFTKCQLKFSQLKFLKIKY